MTRPSASEAAPPPRGRNVRAGARNRETLLAWLPDGSNVPDTAARLHVHPQTVRYRLRQLEQLFGDALHTPDTGLALLLALQADATG